MARCIVIAIAIALTACGASGPTVTTSPLGVVMPSPLAVRFLADLEVTIDEFQLATDAAVQCAAARGVEVEATVTERPGGAVDVGYEVESAQEHVADRCFAANVAPLMSFSGWLYEGVEPERARELALQGR